MPVTQSIAPCFKPYLSINGLVPGKTYRYAAREKQGPAFLPVVSCTMHRPKYRQHPIVYMAIKAGADVRNLKAGEKLYVGSQSGPDRMFRGDGLAKALNFHHAQMREGRDGHGMERYLAAGGQVDIYLAEGPELCAFASEAPKLQSLSRLLTGQVAFTHPAQIKRKDHVGYWAEQLILRDEHSEWAWNIDGVEGPALAAFRLVGV